jgi:hypothetical protein
MQLSCIDQRAEACIDGPKLKAYKAYPLSHLVDARRFKENETAAHKRLQRFHFPDCGIPLVVS